MEKDGGLTEVYDMLTSLGNFDLEPICCVGRNGEGG